MPAFVHFLIFWLSSLFLHFLCFERCFILCLVPFSPFPLKPKRERRLDNSGIEPSSLAKQRSTLSNAPLPLRLGCLRNRHSDLKDIGLFDKVSVSWLQLPITKLVMRPKLYIKFIAKSFGQWQCPFTQNGLLPSRLRKKSLLVPCTLSFVRPKLHC